MFSMAGGVSATTDPIDWQGLFRSGNGGVADSSVDTSLCECLDYAIGERGMLLVVLVRLTVKYLQGWRS